MAHAAPRWNGPQVMGGKAPRDVSYAAPPQVNADLGPRKVREYCELDEGGM